MIASGEAGGASPRRTLYGRSRGRALRPAQERLLVEALPRFEILSNALSGGFAFADPTREVWLEIGFGAGEYLIGLAKANPRVDLIGCEPFLNGVVAALAGIERERLTNLRLRRGDAQGLLKAAQEGCFSRVFLLYPDPWPKRRHRKRRIIGEAMIAALARVMRRGAELRFATDMDDYAGWTLKRFLASPDFRWVAERADDWRRPWREWRPTRYEAKALQAGRRSVYLTFVRL